MKDNRKNKKIKKLIAFCSISSFIFIVATYAWFIGMRQVNVSSFEIEIASTDSLLLSLDGSTWDTTVTINSSNFKTVSYEGNVNNWAGYDSENGVVGGLKPISSIGEIDTASSTMKMFEKGSLTATPGGYRLLASRIHNYETNAQRAGSVNAKGFNTENGGYVAFDLFIRNFSGQAYYENDNILNEEAIYLTTDSEVTVGSTGVEDTGIENSVRVGFAQIGRVNGRTTDVATITGIKCVPGDGSSVTGICRTAQIWEPNDTEHVDAAISYYDTSCRLRPAAVSPATDPTDITLASAYTANSNCGTVVDGQAYPTYAIGKEITAMNAVDVYDGTAFNGYTGTIADTEAIAVSTETGNASKYLYAFPYFTDTMKLKTGVERPTFITLAPNSITKVRVYIYIEGQDIDNYDFASIGKQISVNFGFTKERFTEDDINYQGPDLNRGNGPISAEEHAAQVAADKTAPVIKLNGSQNQTVAKGGEFTRPTVTEVVDNVSTIETSAVRISGTVDTSVAGTYRVLYEVADEAGNVATEVVTVTVTE